MTTDTTTAAAEAASRLRAAAATGTPCAPVRDVLDPSDTSAAYAVQRLGTEARVAAGARVVGRKIGLTSTAVQQQLGVDQPDFGVLFDDMAYGDGDLIPTARLLQPKVEAEIAFVLSTDIDDLRSATVGGVRGSVAYAVAALEIVDSRIAGWDITFADTVADNASSGLFVLADRRLTLDELEPRDVAMQMHVDGRLVSQGRGADCLGDPLAALAWLARTAITIGDPLRAGDIILSGALGPMVPVRGGNRVVADISGLGTVAAMFEEEVSA